MTRPKARIKPASLSEPQFGNTPPFNTSRVTQDGGTTDKPNPKKDTPTTPTKVERKSVKDSVGELKKMGTGSDNYKTEAQKAKDDILQRLADMRNKREDNRSRSGRERGTNKGMDRYMEERKRNQEGTNRVIG